MSDRQLRALRVLLWAAAVFTLVMALVPHPPEIPGEPSDKLQHIAAFTTLALLASFAYPRAIFGIAIGLALFGAAIEVLQTIPALHRDGNALDWIADMGAQLLVLAAVRAYRQSRDHR